MKLQKLKYKALAMAVFLVFGIFWAQLNYTQYANAENGPNTALSVSPMSQRIILVPGETYEGTIAVINGSFAENSLRYSASIAPYSIKTDSNSASKDDYDSFDVIDRSNYNTITDWTSLSKTEGELKPNDKEIITFTIKVPKDAPAGAQYMCILVSTTKDGNYEVQGTANGASAHIESKTQLASAIFANVAGETVEKGSISENNMPSVLTTNKLEATSMVRNDGNIYTDATYTLQVWPLTSDEELCTNEEKAETSMILPNTERYHVQTCNLPAVGIFRAKQVVKIFGEESVLEKTIFVCPVWLMILAVVIVVAIVITIVVMVRKRKKSALQD